MWFLKILRMLLITIDTAVYQCVAWLYELFMLLAETGIFHTEDIRDFADRMYFFLGLIMIFKVSTSIIQFIMNPDATKDSKMGAPKLLKNIVIILVGIVMIPYVFEIAFSLQRIVLEDNVIGSLILGMNYSDAGGDPEDAVKNAGKRMEFTTFTAFFHFNNDYISEACSANPFDYSSDGSANISAACTNDPNYDVIETFLNSRTGRIFQSAYENSSVPIITNSNIYNYTIEDEEGDDQFLFSYLMLVTTLAGAFLAYILLLFCFDVAVRSVKLGFLQLIAPIPLISKIDPKKGDEVFNKWVKECTSTYLSLFIRLVAIYFAIFIISLLDNGMFNVIDPDVPVSNPLVKVFIIFGTLLFVKDLPKLIETITGLKIDGGGLSLKKKLGSVPLIGGAANKAAGLAGRTGLNLAKGVGRMAGAGLNNTVGKGLRNTVGKGLGKVGGAAKKAFNDSSLGNWHAQRVLEGSDMGSLMKNFAANTGTFLNKYSGGAFSDIGRDASTTFSGMGASILDSVGVLEGRKNQILNRQSAGKVEMERNKKLADAISAMESRAVERIKTGAGGELSLRYNRETAEITSLQNMSNDEWSRDARSWDANGNAVSKEDAIAQAQYKLDQWLNSNEQDGAASQYIDAALDSSNTLGISDGTMKNGLYENYKAQAQANGIEAPATDGAGIHSVLAATKTRNNEIQREQMDGNNTIAQIDEQIRSAKEFKSNK